MSQVNPRSSADTASGEGSLSALFSWIKSLPAHGAAWALRLNHASLRWLRMLQYTTLGQNALRGSG